MDIEATATGIKVASKASSGRGMMLAGVAGVTLFAGYGVFNIGGGTVPYLMALAFGGIGVALILMRGDTIVTVDRAARLVSVEGQWRGQSRSWRFDEIDTITAERGASGDSDADATTTFWRGVLQTKSGRRIDLPLVSSERDIRDFASQAQALVAASR